MKIPGSVSVVTGGSSGLGEGVVRAFAASGAKVAIWDLDSESGERISKEFQGQVEFFKVDITSEDSVKSAIENTIKKFSRIDILVNCAGILLGEMTATSKSLHSLDSFSRVIKVNLIGTFNTCRLVAKVMMAQTEVDKEKGVIVNIASIAGYEGQRGQTAYASSKGGILGLTLPLARDLAVYGIRVNTLAPGVFDTKMGTGISDVIKQKIFKETLAKRPGRPDELAHAVKFLVENTYMNGSALRIDGGLRLPNI
jgi:3-hydroxyacyl-CoA dehydrogenase / 3-hydroxy-2-methylbutyryl-CoA dehydrogenase